MKALVLCGGLPQAALIKELKNRGIETVLADMNPDVVARKYADAFFAVSTLDVKGVRELAREQKVDMVLTACADQVLLVQAQVSEELGLPCYIDLKKARDVSSKERMKDIFAENAIPSSRYVIMNEFDVNKTKELQFPLIVKPVDSYSSRGVRKVFREEELREAFTNAINISRSGNVIVEEFVDGEELTVDAYVENGEAHILCVSNIDKIPGNDRFVICRTKYPAQISSEMKHEVEEVINQIARAFHLKNSPMLVQMITNGEHISVVEFCARTGGGDKFQLIKQVSGFDVIKAIVDLTLGEKPHVEPFAIQEYIINEFLYVKRGKVDKFVGFSEMKDRGVIDQYYQLKKEGTECGEIFSSGDRVAYISIRGKTLEEVKQRDKEANAHIKVLDPQGRDILCHELIAAF